MKATMTTQEAELLAQVNQCKNLAEDSLQGLDAQTADNWNYYNSVLPAPDEGGATFVDPVVYSTVGAAVSQIMPIFTSNEKRAIEAAPLDINDVDNARALTEFLSQEVLERNNGKNALRDTIQEAMLANIAWMKVSWEEDIKTETSIIDRVPKGQVKAYKKKYDEVETVRETQEGTSKLQTLKCINYLKEGKVRLTALPFYSVLFDTSTTDYDNLTYISQRSLETKGSLVDMFDYKTIDDLSIGSTTSTELNSQTMLARNINIISDDGFSGDELSREVWLYEHYIKTSLFTNGKAQQWVQVFTADNQLIEHNIVSDIPFVPFTAISQPHALVGKSLAEVAIPFQKNKTAIRRAITDNTLNIANGRYVAVKGEYDPDSVMNNTAGAIIEVERDINEFQMFRENVVPTDAYNTLTLLDDALEKATGISAMVQGLDPEVLKGNNAASTVIAAMNAGSKRILEYAKNIAESWTEVVKKMYKYLRENDTNTYIVNVGYDTYPIVPSQFKEDRIIKLSAVFGTDANTELAQKLVTTHQLLIENEAMSKSYGPSQQYNLFKDAMEAMGLPNAHLYLQDPATIPVSDEEIYMKEVQRQTTNLELQNLAADIMVKQSQGKAPMLSIANDAQRVEIEKMKLAQDGQIAAEEIGIKQMGVQVDAQKAQVDQIKVVQDGQAKATEIGLKQTEIRHQMTKDAAEMILKQSTMGEEISLEESQQRPVSFDATR